MNIIYKAKKRKEWDLTMKKWIVVVLVILTVLICGILIFNTNVEVEYVPETEIEEVDLRKTMVTLYFQNAENKELQKESRLIDSKDLLLDPYRFSCENSSRRN